MERLSIGLGNQLELFEVSPLGSRGCRQYALLSRFRRVWRTVGMGRGCVKTCTSEERAALFSLLSFPIAVFYFSD